MFLKKNFFFSTFLADFFAWVIFGQQSKKGAGGKVMQGNISLGNIKCDNALYASIKTLYFFPLSLQISPRGSFLTHAPKMGQGGKVMQGNISLGNIKCDNALYASIKTLYFFPLSLQISPRGSFLTHAPKMGRGVK